MKTQFIIISLLLLGFTARAQQPYLSREAYRDKVEAYSQILKQQKLKTMASAEARKIAHTGFLPKIDVNADGTLNMSDLKAWNEPLGEYRNHTYQGVFVVSQPLYTGGALNAQHKIAKADEKLNQLNEELTLDQIHIRAMLFIGMPPLHKLCYRQQTNIKALSNSNITSFRTVLTME